MKRFCCVLVLLCFSISVFAAEDDWMKKSSSNKSPSAVSNQRGRSSEPSVSPSNIMDLPGSIGVLDYYNAGEIYFVFASPAYLIAISANVKDRFAQHRAQFAKVQASAEALQAFDRYTNATLALPLTKSYNDWPADLKDTWNKELSAFYAAFKPTILDNMYFWLGFEAIRFGWAVPRDLKMGFTLKQQMESINSGLGDLEWVAQQPAFSALSTDVQNAVKAIAALKSKVPNSDDPLSAGGSGIQTSDVEDAGHKAEIIRQAAKDGKLVS